MKLPPFDYACPTTLPEAVQLLASHDGDAKAIAGGQSLVPMLAFRLAQPTLLVDLRKLADLRGIRISDQGVTLGAMVRWRDIEDDERLETAHPLLKAAIAARSGAASPMPIRPPKCPGSPSPAMPKFPSSENPARMSFRRPISSKER
jgi:CO/xanthine dehydrogenase FAD-binding subunit